MAMSFDDFDKLLNEDRQSCEPDAETRWIIVAIDDEPAVRETLSALFRDRYEVRVAGSAQEGIALVDEETCAVILDVKMAGYDGFWACGQIRAKYPDIPVIFYSAYQDSKDPYRIINEYRPFAFIVKDGNPTKLLDTVAMAVRLHSITVANRRLIALLRADEGEAP
jgi:DNA-binding NtrC family response regulator